MSEAVGPGTRLLCVESTNWITSGTTYTCSEVYSMEKLDAMARDMGYVSAMCDVHGPECQAGAVQVREIAMDMWPVVAHCLACFRPLGGALPESIMRLLDTPVPPPVRERILETQDA
jgi:hypothetical protein